MTRQQLKAKLNYYGLDKIATDVYRGRNKSGTIYTVTFKRGCCDILIVGLTVRSITNVGYNKVIGSIDANGIFFND